MPLQVKSQQLRKTYICMARENGESLSSSFQLVKRKKGNHLSKLASSIGAKGIAELEINNYTDRDGNPGKNNRVKTFNELTQQAASPAYQAPQQNYQQTPPPQPCKSTTTSYAFPWCNSSTTTNTANWWL